MPRINLLPWREAERQRRQKEFIIWLVVGAALGLGLSAYSYVFVDALINFQGQRNLRLQQEIRVVEKKIKEINEIEKQKANLISRMNVIQQLQQSRPQIVRLFDALVETVPDGVYLTRFTQSDGRLVFTGKAQSNARVSHYMRNLEASAWLADPDLKVIRGAGENSLRDFELTAKQADPTEVTPKSN